MAELKHEHLGAIDPTRPGFWDGTARFAERDLNLDLTIEKSGLEAGRVEALLAQLDELEALDQRARAAIQQSSRGDEEAGAVLYVDHHLEELDDETLSTLFGATPRDELGAIQILPRLVLLRVGLYPESSDAALLFDYSLGREVTDYVLCVSFDAEGNVRSVEVES